MRARWVAFADLIPLVGRHARRHRVVVLAPFVLATDAEPAVAAFVVVILRSKLVAKRPVKVRCAPGRAKYSSGPLAKEHIAEGFLPRYAFAEAYCGSADLREGKS